MRPWRGDRRADLIFDVNGVDLDVQPDVTSAEGQVEVYDIGGLKFFAVDGTILEPTAEGYRVRLRPTDTKEPAELRSRLSVYLSHPSVPVDASLADDPARAAEALLSRPWRDARWWRRRRHG